MTVLSIETATAVCGVGLVRSGALVGEQFLEGRSLHAERLLSMIDAALQDAGMDIRDVEGVAVSIGPGSFTGLRIGLSVAKGLVFGLGRSLAAVPTLEALAQRLVTTDSSPHLLAALDARRDEVYCQLFRRSGVELHPEGPPEDLPVAAVARLLEGKRAVVTGDGTEKVLAEVSPGSAIVGAPPDLRRCSAATVGLLGAQLLRAGQVADPATLEPRYIKEFFLRTPSSHKEGE